MTLGQVPLWADLKTCPWWWSRIIQLETRLDGIRKTGPYDPEKLEPPKDLWPLNRSDELESWLESREALRKTKSKTQDAD